MQTIEQGFREFRANCIKQGAATNLSKEQMFSIYATFLSGVAWMMSQIHLFSAAPDAEFTHRMESIEAELQANLKDMSENRIKV